MTPAARVAAAIEVVDAWAAGGEDRGLDRVLTAWGRAHRFAGSGDRHAIADLVYDTVRRMRSAAWVAGAPDPTEPPAERAADGRALLRGSLMLDGIDPATLFTGQGHAPPPLSEAERRPARPIAAAPRPVRLDLPDWLSDELAETPDAVLEALRARAPLDLRANLLKATPAEAIAALAGDGIEAEPVPLSPTALRMREGPRRVAGSRAYREGLVEIQDAASQAVADLAAARPGETVLDLCAGGGGKTLALAAAMRNEGRLIAHDAAPQRIAGLPERAARAGARVEIVDAAALEGLADGFAGGLADGLAADLVFVDAPCSGSGAWRRNPDAKWRLTSAALDRLTATQDALLDRAARLAAQGAAQRTGQRTAQRTGRRGRVLYATCSILRRENEARVDAFLARAPGWRLAESRAPAPPAGDGFYGAMLDIRDNPREN